MQVISPVIRASGSSSFYFDSTTNATSKFYRIEALP